MANNTNKQGFTFLVFQFFWWVRRPW
jgi:hypothetical protein